jgi:hypothetical protein
MHRIGPLDLPRTEGLDEGARHRRGGSDWRSRVLDYLSRSGQRRCLGLIRSRGHLSKGGYDGTHGIKQGWPASPAAVL